MWKPKSVVTIGDSLVVVARVCNGGKPKTVVTMRQVSGRSKRV